MTLIDITNQFSHRPVMPLMGYPGIQLTGSTIWQNEFNADMQVRTLKALADQYQPDALFPFMDLAVEAGAIGLPVVYPLNESPTVIEHPVKSANDLKALRVVDPLNDARVRTFVDVVHRLAEETDMLTGAYVIGPFTLAGLMVGASEIAMATITDPALVHACLEFAVEVIKPIAKAYDDAGADMLMVLEPTVSFISPKAFRTFSGPYLERIYDGLEAAPILHICGKTDHLIDAMCETGAQGLSLDAQLDLTEVIHRVPPDVVLIGNIDPVGVMANGTAGEVRQAAADLLSRMESYPNFILSTGCDLPPETPLENIGALMSAAHEQTGTLAHSEC